MLNFDKLQNAQEQGRQRKQDYEINLAASNISLINAFKNVIFDTTTERFENWLQNELEEILVTGKTPKIGIATKVYKLDDNLPIIVTVEIVSNRHRKYCSYSTEKIPYDIFDNELKYVYAKEAAKLVSILEDRLNAFNLIVLEGEHASLDNGYDAVLFPIKIGE